MKPPADLVPIIINLTSRAMDSHLEKAETDENLAQDEQPIVIPPNFKRSDKRRKCFFIPGSSHDT